jgi:hypothetical protein
MAKRAAFLMFLLMMKLTKALKTRRNNFNAGEILSSAFFKYHENT